MNFILLTLWSKLYIKNYFYLGHVQLPWLSHKSKKVEMKQISGNYLLSGFFNLGFLPAAYLK